MPVFHPLRLALYGLVAGLIFASPLSAETQAFFSKVDDLPLAPGLTEATDDAVSFDSPSGRIVTAVAFGRGPGAAFRAFYDEALPALGWTPAPGGGYQREDEYLTIAIEPVSGEVAVRIRIVPRQTENTR